MLSREEFLQLVDKTSLKSRYFKVFRDGHPDIIYNNCTVEIIDSGKSIEKIIARLEDEHDMEWRFAYCDTFPRLKPNGKYHLLWDVGSYFYSVRKNGLYEVDRHFD